jgi:hypothetical protein
MGRYIPGLAGDLSLSPLTPTRLVVLGRVGVLQSGAKTKAGRQDLIYVEHNDG